MRSSASVAAVLVALVSCARGESAPTGTLRTSAPASATPAPPATGAPSAPSATVSAPATAATAMTLPAPTVPPQPLPPHPDEPRSANRACQRDADCAIYEEPCSCAPCDAEWHIARNIAFVAKRGMEHMACPPTDGCPCPARPPVLPGQAPPFRGYIGSRAVCVDTQCTVAE
jgi:hypothetical protein